MSGQTIRDVVIRMALELRQPDFRAPDLTVFKQTVDEAKRYADEKIGTIHSRIDASARYGGGGGSAAGVLQGPGLNGQDYDPREALHMLEAEEQLIRRRTAAQWESHKAQQKTTKAAEESNVVGTQSIGILQNQAENALKLARGIGLLGTALGGANSQWLQYAAAAQGAMDTIGSIGGVGQSVVSGFGGLMRGMGAFQGPSAAMRAARRASRGHRNHPQGSNWLGTAADLAMTGEALYGMGRAARGSRWMRKASVMGRRGMRVGGRAAMRGLRGFGGLALRGAGRLAAPLALAMDAPYAMEAAHDLYRGKVTDPSRTLLGYDLTGQSKINKDQLQANLDFYQKPLKRQSEVSRTVGRFRGAMADIYARAEFDRSSGRMSDEDYLSMRQRDMDYTQGEYAKQAEGKDALTQSRLAYEGQKDQVNDAKEIYAVRQKIVAELEREKMTLLENVRIAHEAVEVEKERLSARQEQLGAMNPEETSRLNAIGEKLARGQELTREEALYARQHGETGANNEVGLQFQREYEKNFSEEARRGLGHGKKLKEAQEAEGAAVRNQMDAVPEIQDEIEKLTQQNDDLAEKISGWMKSEAEFKVKFLAMLEEYEEKRKEAESRMKNGKQRENAG